MLERELYKYETKIYIRRWLTSNSVVRTEVVLAATNEELIKLYRIYKGYTNDCN
jgi:hypothetical protein